MDSIAELALLVGQLHQKTDQQTTLLHEIKDSTCDLSNRVASLEASRSAWKTAWKVTKVAGLWIIGWFTGKHF